MPPIIEWADFTGVASIATTTAHPIVILRSITILPVCHPRGIVRAQLKNIQMTNDLISDGAVISLGHELSVRN
jgi:hypothetical protein